MPVVVHVGDIGTKKSIELAEHAYRAGADAISSVPPFYWKFRAGDIYNYYRDISESTPLPMVVYNIQLAGLMDMDLLLQLAGLPNVHGLKYTARSHDEMGFIKKHWDWILTLYSGCDGEFFGMCSGADGIIGSLHNLFPGFICDLGEGGGKRYHECMRLQAIADEVIFAALI